MPAATYPIMSPPSRRPADAHQHRVGRKKYDVLLDGRIAGRVAVAVGDDLQVPAGIPADRQVQQLVAEMPQRRTAVGEAEHEHREVADRSITGRVPIDDRRGGADRRQARPGGDAVGELAIQWLLRRREMPRDADRDAPEQQRQRRRDRDPQAAKMRTESAGHRDDRGDEGEQETDTASSVRAHAGADRRSFIERT